MAAAHQLRFAQIQFHPGEFNIKAHVILVGFHQFVIELCPRPVNGEEIFEIL